MICKLIYLEFTGNVSFETYKSYKQTCHAYLLSDLQLLSGLGILSVLDHNSEIGTDLKQPKAQKNRSYTGPLLRKFSLILSDI